MTPHLLPPNHDRMDPAPTLYTIRIHGHLGATVLFAFSAMDSRHQGTDTVLTGRLDRSALYGVLSDIESLGLELVEVRRETPGSNVSRWVRGSPFASRSACSSAVGRQIRSTTSAGSPATSSWGRCRCSARRSSTN